MVLNKELPVPLYHQLQEIFEENILSGKWEPGFQLPPEKEIAASFGVSNITVKRAIIELVNKGLLFRQRGKGTFVSTDSPEEKDIYKLITFSNKENGRYPHDTVNFSIDKADIGLAKSLNLKESEEVIKLNRIKIERNTPIGIEYSFLPYSFFPNFTPDLVKDELIYNVLKDKYNIKLDRAKIFFSVTMADEYQSEILEVDPETPLVFLERTTFTLGNKIVEHSKFFMRQDKARYYLEVNLK